MLRLLTQADAAKLLRLVQEGKPAWGKSNNPVWQSNRVEPAKPGSRVRPVEMSVENLSRVPGLVRRK